MAVSASERISMLRCDDDGVIGLIIGDQMGTVHTSTDANEDVQMQKIELTPEQLDLVKVAVGALRTVSTSRTKSMPHSPRPSQPSPNWPWKPQKTKYAERLCVSV